MYNIGEYVVCGNKGVCTVEDITKLTLPGADKEQSYYILRPVYLQTSTVYMPVSSSDGAIRRVLSEDEAKKLVDNISEVPVLSVSNDKFLEQEYKVCMRSNECTQLVRVIKTISDRKKKRLEAGRKVTALDAKYGHLAEENLYGELAIALHIPKNEVENYIISHSL